MDYAGASVKPETKFCRLIDNDMTEVAPRATLTC